MPNICTNKLKVVGKPGTLNDVVNLFTEEGFWLVEFDRIQEDVLYIKCQTRWEVPYIFLRHLVERFPDIHLFNQYDIEHVNCGILILYTQHGAVKEKSFTWADPYMYVEGAVWDDGI